MILDVVNGPFGKEGWDAFAKELLTASGLILYHGTSDVFLERILEQGLLPRSQTGNSVYEGEIFGEKNLESQADKVYLIHKKRIGCGGNNAVSKWGGSLVGIRVFIPDVSFLDYDEDSPKKTWHESIAFEDSCTHKGVIPSKQILGYFRRGSPEQYTQIHSEPKNVVRIGEDTLAFSFKRPSSSKHTPIFPLQPS